MFFFFKTKLRYLKLKEWLQELAISIEIVSVALNVTKNWILLLVVKVNNVFLNDTFLQNLRKNHNNSGPDGEIYCQSCYSFEFGTKARTKPIDTGLKK